MKRSKSSVHAQAGLDKAVHSNARLLVLGSLPGAASLNVGQYYAHPRNAFWPLIGAVLGENLAQLPYRSRLFRLEARGIGLWDVIANAHRSGSLDASIRSPTMADLRGLIEGLPDLRAVAFNGSLAARLGRRILGDLTEIELIDLPSSSPAHARSLSEKAKSWAILERFVLPDRHSE